VVAVSGVFINYRTDDGDWAARHVWQELADRFGPDQVFYASMSIKPGEDFPTAIDRRLLNSDLLLAFVGRRWLVEDCRGQRRIDDPDDWVRREIRTALANGIRVIPVLLDDVARIDPADLPEDIVALARCQYQRLHHRNQYDLDALVDEVTTLLPAAVGERWRVRITDPAGAVVLGAGVLLGDGHVLTSAHVVAGAGGAVVVHYAGAGGSAPPARATVVPEWCVPPLSGQRGDVALLRLESPRPASAGGATLRRTALSWDRAVRVCGFPRGLEDGVHSRATLTAAGGPAGEWLPLTARSAGEQRIRSGFGGAGVVDEATGDVLGIVVGEHTDQTSSPSWMIPVETILNHIPNIQDWVVGDGAADEVFSKPLDSSRDHDQHARAMAEWLTRRDTGDCLLIVVGSRVAAMYQAVALSSREHHSAVLDRPPDAVPALGSVDLAIDASGKTVEEVSRRILSRAGIPLDATVSAADQLRVGGPPMTIVVDGVDEARQPDALLEQVLRPMAEQGSRLVLAFRDDSSASLRAAHSWDVGSVAHRLTRLAQQLDRLDAVLRELSVLRARAGAAAPGGQATDAEAATGEAATGEATRLRAALQLLRRMAGDPDPATIREPLERCERRSARQLREATRMAAELTEWLAEIDVLRGCLGAYQAKAKDAGLAEEVGLDELYRRAYALLWRPPTDVPAARAAVRDYLLAIRRPGGGPGGQRP
jgi:serine protease Do